MKDEMRILSKALDIKAKDLNRALLQSPQANTKENQAPSAVSKGALLSCITSGEKLQNLKTALS